MVARLVWVSYNVGKTHKKVKRVKVCVTKGKKIGAPKINIGNKWKEFETTNELKEGHHVVFIMIIYSTFKV
jgi:hypothetical protein